MDLRIFYLKSRDVYIVEGLIVSRRRRGFPAITAFAWTGRLFSVPGQKKPVPLEFLEPRVVLPLRWGGQTFVRTFLWKKPMAGFFRPLAGFSRCKLPSTVTFWQGV
jgi:hypothetical protein